MAPGALLLACDRFGIDTPLERAHFFAQCAHESSGFLRLVESLNYSAERLRAVWPKRFDAQQAFTYAHRPVAIANRVYADRLGNGGEDSGDGWMFRGRGYLQITGRANYQQTSLGLYSDTRLLTTPMLLEQPLDAANAAALYWGARHLSIPALKDDLVAVTRGVNGGTNGLEGRRQWLAKFKAEFGC